jgi:hypothetical protein
MPPDFSHHWAYWSRHTSLWVLPLKYVFGFVAAWGAIYLRRWQKRRSEERAQGWPSIEGRISGGKVVAIPKTSRFLATLTYIFFLEEYHTGKYTHEFSKEDDANDFVRNMRDQRVHIRYKQSNPGKSVLEQSVVEQHILLAPRFG